MLTNTDFVGIRNSIRAVRTQRTFACGWLVLPVYCNSLDRNVIYAVTPPINRNRPEPVNPVALALTYQKMLAEGTLDSQAQLARKLGLTRARVTQLLNLLKLPPAIVAELSDTTDPVQISFYTERRLRSVAELDSIKEQLRAFRTLKEQFLSLRQSDRQKPTTPGSR